MYISVCYVYLYMIYIFDIINMLKNTNATPYNKHNIQEHLNSFCFSKSIAYILGQTKMKKSIAYFLGLASLDTGKSMQCHTHTYAGIQIHV